MARFPVRPSIHGDLDAGWVASGPLDSDDTFLRSESLKCPTSLDLATLMRLTPLAVTACRIEVTTVAGVVNSCYEGPVTPFAYEPDWIWFSCLFIHDQGEEQGRWYPISLPPDYAGPELERGDVVVLHGQLGFDTDRYGDCMVTGEEAAEALEAERLIWAIECQHRFVVSGAEITGHIDLPPLY